MLQGEAHFARRWYPHQSHVTGRMSVTCHRKDGGGMSQEGRRIHCCLTGGRQHGQCPPLHWERLDLLLSLCCRSRSENQNQCSCPGARGGWWEHHTKIPKERLRCRNPPVSAAVWEPSFSLHMHLELVWPLGIFVLYIPGLISPT